MVSVNSFTWMEFVGLYLHLAGFIIGLGAVTVIDLHGFLGRKSPYWTEATTRTHKVTKPLIWLGMTLAIMGAVVFHYQTRLDLFVSSAGSHYVRAHREWVFLSFYVSPFLLRREREGRASELLPPEMQKKIAIAFVLSFAGWWSELLLTVYQVLARR